jgi:predicted dehydrogenase
MQLPDNIDASAHFERRIEPVRLGLVGFGKLAEDYYLPAFRRHVGLNVVAVADPLDHRRQKARSAFSLVKTYASHVEMLAGDELDGVLFATPPSMHCQSWMDVDQTGLPVFIEKPLLIPGQLSKIPPLPSLRAPVMVNFNRRRWPAYQQVAAIVRRGSIGRIESAHFRFTVNVRPWLSVTTHRLQPSEGGMLYDLGSQLLDLVGFILDDEPVRIRASEQQDLPDNSVMHLELEMSRGLCVHASLGYSQSNHERVLIRGENATVWIPDPNMAIHLRQTGRPLTSVSGHISDYMTLLYRAIRRQRSMLRHTIELSLIAFARAIRGREPFAPGIEEGLRNALWLEAARRSIATGASIDVNTIKHGVQCLA